jgi:hypothetical protein
MIMKSEKFKNIFEAMVTNKKVKHSLFDRMLAMICGRSIYREKVRLLELSLLQRIIRVGGVVLISTNIILITASSFKAYEILISP